MHVLCKSTCMYSVIVGGDRNTVDQLELLQQQMLTQQEQSTAALTSSLKEVHMISSILPFSFFF